MLPLTQSELEEDLCDYCECTEFGETKINTAPYDMCFGGYCDQAYENYLDDFKEKKK